MLSPRARRSRSRASPGAREVLPLSSSSDAIEAAPFAGRAGAYAGSSREENFMWRIHRSLVVLALAIFVLSVPRPAAAAAGSVRGTVSGPDAKPMGGVPLTL